MTRAPIAVLAFLAVLAVCALGGYWLLVRDASTEAVAPDAIVPATTPTGLQAHPVPETHHGFLYGRITTVRGAVYEGRLRWGVIEEAFWSDTFNGWKEENPWIAHVPQEQRVRRDPIRVLGVEISRRERKLATRRPFMARFGDITRIERQGNDVRVTLKSGTAFELDGHAAGDFDDRLRVRDVRHGVMDIEGWHVQQVELLPTPPLDEAPYRLHGTVQTTQGDFTGFIQWDRESCVGSDTLDGRSSDEDVQLRFDTIRSIVARPGDGARVTLLDGREIVLSGAPAVGKENRGIYVDDRRYGRVLVAWVAFQRADFTPGGSGAGYDDFPAGRPLTGSVVTRDGTRWVGRLVFDLDESETTETLDAPTRGVTYTIPFGRIASIVLADGEEHAAVSLNDGEALQLELAGDLGDDNGGMLIFVDEQPRYVPWTDVVEIQFDPPAVKAAINPGSGQP